MSSISLGSLHASPFCLATTNSTASLAQMNAFTAKWVKASSRTWEGNAMCFGSVVPADAIVGAIQFSVPNTGIIRQHFGGVWGNVGASKNVSDDSFIALTSNCTWSYNSVTGSSSILPARSRIVITRIVE